MITVVVEAEEETVCCAIDTTHPTVHLEVAATQAVVANEPLL